ncbi:MAG TPA: hypothetical protein VJO13_05830 [Ktedonobacterales bacterium]|nr:hypothetical protein [Ktedonobacterales bacterium]
MSATPPVEPSENGAIQRAQAFARQRPIVAGIAGLIAICVVIGVCSSLAQGITGTSKASSTRTASTIKIGSSATKAPAGPTATHAPTATPTPSFKHFGDGTFQVGKDIQPGTYRTRQGSPGCYWARLSGFGGSVGEIIANDNTDAPAVVTIAASDKGFESQGCGTWTQNLSQVTKSKTTFGDGTYIIGTDITPGTYKNTGNQGCYYARLSGFGGTTDEIIANNNTDSAAIVTIDGADKGFQSNGCGTWTMQ